MSGPPRLPLPYRPLVPVVEAWIRYHERSAALRARPLPTETQLLLAPYFPTEALGRARLVIVEDLPRVPIPDLGLKVLRDFLRGRFSGLTLRETIFVRPERASDAGLVFHEMVHVLQWALLGLRPFIHAYGRGLLDGGYRGCPLEVVAYELEDRFRRGGEPFRAEPLVRHRLGLSGSPRVERPE